MQIKNQQFQTTYQRLNTAQRLAVDTIEGPVLVIAGPGTGKTEILAARIANILHSTDAAPENILCLTYTDAGTVAMRNRLLQFIGTEAYRVDIFTFHAFCNLVIQEQSSYFGIRNLTTISELEQYQYLQEIIDGFPVDHPLTRATGDIYYEAGRLIKLYEIMKSEGWSSNWLMERIDTYAASLPENPDFIYKRQGKTPDGTSYKKGDLNLRKLNDELRRLEQLKAAAASFDDYQQLLQQRGRYDFADMILWCNAAFKNNSDLLATYQERYLYLLVDEFQDTSGSQFELLEQLSGYWDAPNLFVVGDDDQSIYRFQGASVENIHRFTHKYKQQLTTITLTENHRSSQNILDAAAGLIARNSERLSHDKQLLAKNLEVSELEQKPELLEFVSTSHETIAIAERIKGLIADGVEPDQIALIYRNHNQAEQISRYLMANGIGIQSKRRTDLLQEPLIIKLLTILRYLVQELEKPHSGQQLLYQLLHETWFGISPLALARLSVEIGRRRTEQKPCYWREQLLERSADKGQQQLFPSRDDQQLYQAGQQIDELIRDAATLPLQELLHQIITKLGILAQALNAEQRIWNLTLLNSLFDFVREETNKGLLTATGLLTMLADMQKQGIRLPAEKLSYSGKGVNFLTAHGSKGLQFDHLFIIGCTSQVWDSSARNRTYKLPPTIWSGPVGSEEEESRRLFYVAVTRARKQVVISWAKRDNKDKELEKSRFVAELLEDGQVDTRPETALGDEALLAFGNTSLLADDPARLPTSFIDTEFVDKLLEKYSLSVTHLNSYLRCPVTFYFNTLLRVPAPLNAALTFGSAVHYALEQVFRKMKNNSQRFPDSEVLLEGFRWFMARHETALSASEYRRRLEYGEQILPQFYEIRRPHWKHDVLVEYPFRNILLDDVPLNGKLDLMELSGNHITVVDYKTGNPANARKKMKPPAPDKVEKALLAGKEPAADDLLGGDYWRQAVFYRILVENEPNRRRLMSAARFEFVEPERDSGEYKCTSFEVSDEEVEIVKQQIKDVYGKIKAKQFENGCNKPECEWCNFVKRLKVVRHQEEAKG